MKYDQIFIKSEADLPKESGLYFGCIARELGEYYYELNSEYDYLLWMDEPAWYLQPLPEQESKSAEDFLKKKYKTDFISPDVQFSKRLLIENMEEFNAQSHQVEMPGGEEIKNIARETAQKLGGGEFGLVMRCCIKAIQEFKSQIK